MNRIITNLLASFIISLAGTTQAQAYDIAVENDDGKTIYYNYSEDGTELSVTCMSYSNKNAYIGNVKIPEEVTYMNRTRKVTSIGKSAFKRCDGLTSVTIGNNVTSIGNEAFYICDGLTSVTIPSSVTSVGDGAFLFCDGLTSVHISDIAAWCKIEFTSGSSNPLYYAHHLYLNGKEVKDLVIPDSVTSIGSYAFYCCSGLTSVTIPNSVTSIGNKAFYNCSSLTSVAIPNSVTSIGDYAFEGCSGLTSVKFHCPLIGSWFSGNTSIEQVLIGDEVTSIGYSAFKGCSGITAVTIPNSVTSIGDEAFYYCTGLTSVTIGNSVTSIGGNPFYGCNGLTSINVPVTDYAAFCNNKVVGLIGNRIGRPVLLIDEKGNEIKNFVVPNSVTSIGDGAFKRCTSLTSVTIPNSVTSIGGSAFYNCI